MEGSSVKNKYLARPYLTYRQKQCLILLSEGRTCAAIALELGITVRTVRTHLRGAKIKLRAHSTTEAAVLAFKMGLLDRERND